jgi:hypothetical protein
MKEKRWLCSPPRQWRACSLRERVKNKIPYAEASIKAF